MSLEDLLDAQSLATLRAQFDRSTLDGIARDRLIALYPAGHELPDAILTHFFPVDGDGGLPAAERERVVLAVLLSQNADAVQIAIHIYWGLMEGLSVHDVVETFLLSGYYAGIFRYQRALTITELTLKALATTAATGDATVRTVLGAVGSAVRGA